MDEHNEAQQPFEEVTQPIPTGAGHVEAVAIETTGHEQKIYYHETIKEEPKKAKRKGRTGRIVAGVLAGSLVGGAAAGVGFAFAAPYGEAYYHQLVGTESIPAEKVEELTPYTTPLNYTLNTTSENPVPIISEKLGPSVVSINNNSTVTTWMGEFSQASLGSGVIFYQNEEKVYIISNAHVVEGANTLTVTFLGNTRVQGHIIGYDTSTDIAVVGVDKADIPEEMQGQIKEAPLGDSDMLRVGEQVVAIGTPIDEAYYNTVSVGYVSALGRQVSLTDQELTLIQTDAAINPGNSGGALVGPTGEVIGINTMKLANSENSIEGMGFAIPINDVKPVVEELMRYGKIIRPSLGITGQNMTEEFGAYWEIPVGIHVYEVIPGSSADLGGINPGDIIIEFGDVRIATMEELKDLLGKKKVGDEVRIKVVRGSEKISLDIRLQEMPSTRR